MHKSIISKLVGQGNIIAVPKVFIQALDSHVAALMLTQLIYWSDKADGKTFHITDERLSEEICASAYQLRKARKQLEEWGVTHERRGTPARMVYSVDLNVVENKLSSFCTTGPQKTPQPPIGLKTKDQKSKTPKEKTPSDSPSKNEKKTHMLDLWRMYKRDEWVDHRGISDRAWGQYLELERVFGEKHAPVEFVHALQWASTLEWTHGATLSLENLGSNSKLVRYAEQHANAMGKMSQAPSVHQGDRVRWYPHAGDTRRFTEAKVMDVLESGKVQILLPNDSMRTIYPSELEVMNGKQEEGKAPAASNGSHAEAAT